MAQGPIDLERSSRLSLRGHGCADSTNRTQNTISSTVKVYYPFHPLQGLELVVLRSPRRGEGAVNVRDRKGVSLKIPSWMLHPSAADTLVSQEAEISSHALLCVVALLEFHQMSLQKTSSRNDVKLPQPGHGPSKGGNHASDGARLGNRRRVRASDSTRPKVSRRVGSSDGVRHPSCSSKGRRAK
jgi:hypothetical protein